MTSSGQSHQLKAGKHKKARLPVGLFCTCRSAVLPFFPFILGYFFQFFCCVQCCLSRWPTDQRRYRHFHKSHFFSKLSHRRLLKKLSVFLMDAVVAVRYVKSEAFRRGLDEKIYERTLRFSKKAHKLKVLLAYLKTGSF